MAVWRFMSKFAVRPIASGIAHRAKEMRYWLTRELYIKLQLLWQIPIPI